jgi:sigma-B regulation protein RsbU (phosphoserine phosphatase)
MTGLISDDAPEPETAAARTVLVADPRGAPPPVLLAALEDSGLDVRLLPVDGLAVAGAEPRPGPADLLLAAAALPVDQVRAIERRMDGEPPVLVFDDGDLGALERHVRSGADYLVPPFHPTLVAARVRAAVERGERERDRRRLTARARLRGYERELEIGRQIQTGFLPDLLPVPEGWQIEVEFRPARQVAGDFYDVFELVDRRRLALIVADVCDKGVGAALFMALIRTLVRHTAENSGLLVNVAAGGGAGTGPAQVPQSLYGHHGVHEHQGPNDHRHPQHGHHPHGRGGPVVGATPLLTAVTSTNRYLTTTHPKQGYFATLFFGVLDPATGDLVYVNCGHNPPLVLAAGGGARAELEPTGPAVGVVPDGVFSLGYERLEPGESLFAFTDGVPEARAGGGEFFGDPRVLDLADPPLRHARELLERTTAAIDAHTAGAEQFDDITMMAVRRNAPAAPTRAGRGTRADERRAPCPRS